VPLIEVTLFDFRVNDESVELMVRNLTDALCESVGEGARDATWVIVHGVSPSRWGIAGEVQSGPSG
jgi:phenylpyruvate tautomerase PptA (4-oxalocrotonate tautomerase family)